MAGQTIITLAMKRKIRELHALGVPFTKIARQLGIGYETVRRHGSDIVEAKIKAQQRKRYEKERATKPEVVERRRAKAREYAAKKREEYVKNPRKKREEVTSEGNNLGGE